MMYQVQNLVHKVFKSYEEIHSSFFGGIMFNKYGTFVA